MPSAPATSPAQHALDAFIHDYMRAMNAPGLTLALADRYGTLRTASYGFSEIESATPLRPDQPFQIGSLTKSFVAIVLLQLQQEGKLELQRPVLEYLPWLPIESDMGAVTAQTLLTHSSGLPDPLGLQPPDPSYRYRQRFSPGEHFHYCNLGFAILGELIRRLDNRPWTDAVRIRIFEPLRMRAASAIYDTATRRRAPLSYVPFASDRFEMVDARLAQAGPETFEDAAGSICAPAADMARYMTVLLDHGAPLLTPDSFAAMTQPHIKAEDFSPTASYGYGIAVDTLDEHKILRHTGGTRSYMTAFMLDVDAGLGAFASVNAQLGYRPNAVVQYALRLLRAEREGRPLPAPPVLFRSQHFENAAEYAGQYTSPNGRTVTIVANDDRLIWNENGRSYPIQVTFGGAMFIADAAYDRFPILFSRDPENPKGSVTELAIGPEWFTSASYRGRREFPMPDHWRAFVGNYLADSPWLGGTRVLARKGKLWLDGATELFPVAGNLFRPAEPAWSPEEIEFYLLADGKARVMRLSGSSFFRADVD